MLIKREYHALPYYICIKPTDFMNKLLIILIAVLTVSCSAPEPPDIVFILVDDLGWADVQCNNPESFYETPNISRLANIGVRFTNAYAAGPVCSPTRASIMTGKYPARLHITDWIPGQSVSCESREWLNIDGLINIHNSFTSHLVTHNQYLTI